MTTARPAARLTLADLARLPRPGTAIPARLGFTPDGTGIVYLFSEAGSLVNIELDVIARYVERLMPGFSD